MRAVPGVTRAAPIVDGQVMASANGANAGVLVRGMRKDDLQSLTTVSKSLSDGALDHYGGGDWNAEDHARDIVRVLKNQLRLGVR